MPGSSGTWPQVKALTCSGQAIAQNSDCRGDMGTGKGEVRWQTCPKGPSLVPRRRGSGLEVTERGCRCSSRSMIPTSWRPGCAAGWSLWLCVRPQ